MKGRGFNESIETKTKQKTKQTSPQKDKMAPANQTPGGYKQGSFTVLCVFSSYSFWTSSSLDVPAGVTQEGSHTGFFIHLSSAVRALIFLARRIQHSFPSSTVKSNFVY